MGFPISSTLLDFCVLSLVRNKDRYGYSFTQRMQKVMDISESTIYPVLRRLKKDKLLTTYDREYQGRNRKYYTITDKGLEKLDEFQEEWVKFKSIIDTITSDDEEEDEDDQG